MKKLNQKGFTLVEGLLVAVLVSVIGFAGYYVWNENQGDDAYIPPESVEQSAASGLDSEISESDSSLLAYSDDSISFMYPKEYGTATLYEYDYEQDTMPTKYEFSSPEIEVESELKAVSNANISLMELTIFNDGIYKSLANGDFDYKKGTFSSEQDYLVDRFSYDGVDYVFEISFGEGTGGPDRMAGSYSQYVLHRVGGNEHIGISGYVSYSFQLDIADNIIKSDSDLLKEELREALLSIISTVED